jgi:hypothetical protein
MAPPPSNIKRSSQNILNDSYDEIFNVLTTESLVYNPVTGVLDRMVQPGATLPTSGTNPSTVLSYTGANLTTVTETINGVQYRTTLGYDGSNNLISVSSAVQI